MLVALGLLGIGAGIGLWTAHPRGRTLALAWAGLWVLEEATMAVYGAIGPEIIQQVSGSPLSNLIRIVVGLAVFYYVWTVGEQYVRDREPTGPTRSG